MRARRLFAVVAGGGTAGHVQPALAIAKALVALGHKPESIGYVGSRRGLESTLVPPAGFALTTMPGRGLPRSLDLRAVGALAGFIGSCVLSFAYLVTRRPRVIVTVGGYAGLPIALAGWLLRVPVVVAESNAVPGIANRAAARVAAFSAVAFAGTGLRHEVVTGNPVRPEITAVGTDPGARERAKEELGLDAECMMVLVTGGSLGARSINEATFSMIDLLKDRKLAVRHVVGRRDWRGRDWMASGVETTDLLYQPVEYDDRMDLSLAAADLVIGRAGATTVAELCAAGRAAVLVPLPGAPGDHQNANARVLASAGAARVVADAECSAGRLASEIESMAQDPAARAAMENAARQLARPDAASAIAQLAVSVAKGRSG